MVNLVKLTFKSCLLYAERRHVVLAEIDEKQRYPFPAITEAVVDAEPAVDSVT